MSPAGERHVLVTGGTGFVGAAVVRALAARGAAVHVLARASADRSALAGVDVTWHAGDIEDEAGLRAAFSGASGAARGAPLDVVHLAARISYRRADRERLRRANVEGTRHVLCACRSVPVRRLCHVSSVVALGCVGSEREELDDDAPLGGLRLDSAYACTKAQAEELVRAAAGELDAVVASPAVVFGVSPAGANSLRFLRRAACGRLGPLSPPGSISVVGLTDAAEGIVGVLERGTRARRYLLSESTWRLHDLLCLASLAAGRSGPRLRIPAGPWRVLVRALAALDRLRPAEQATPEALALLGLHFRFRARRAREELGWRPRPFPEVLAEIVAWMGAGGAG